MNTLTIQHLSKKFGTHEVLKDVTFEVPAHSVFGFLGQNGAGKTTTMKTILGLLKADSGSIEVLSEKVTYGQTATNRHIGYLPDVPEFYSYMKPREYLTLCGEITGLTSSQIKKKSGELLELTGLAEANRKIGGFSRGMKQRLGIAQALMNDPALLICDEPTSALDPVGRKEILDILSCVRGKTTVLFSTHILTDVERICDKIAVLHQGKLVLNGSLEEIKETHRSNKLLLEFADNTDLQCFQHSSIYKRELSTIQQEGVSILFTSQDIKSLHREIIAFLAESQLLPIKLELLEPTLENLFMEVIG